MDSPQLWKEHVILGMVVARWTPPWRTRYSHIGGNEWRRARHPLLSARSGDEREEWNPQGLPAITAGSASSSSSVMSCCSFHAHALARSSLFSSPRRGLLLPSPPSSARPHAARLLSTSCSTGSTTTAPLEPLQSQPRGEDSTQGWSPPSAEEQQLGGGAPSGREKDGKKEDAGVAKEKKGISGIYVPRQKYIPVPKGDLLDGLLSLFETKEDADQFLRFAKCLDSILHAEHKEILEQMRIYHTLMHTEDNKANKIISSRIPEEFMSIGQHFSPDSSLGMDTKEINGKRLDKWENNPDLYNGLDLQSLFISSFGGVQTNSDKESRLIPIHFQRTFMKLLQNAQFEELSVEDLLLTYALNTDYLLTLPIYVDWKRASESNAVIFRRGYATERQKGLLIIEKLDYLQSKLLQEILFNTSRPLKKLGIWIHEALKNSNQTDELKTFFERAKAWLTKQTFPPAMHSFIEGTFSDQLEAAQEGSSELPIWLAAQRAARRYEGFLSSIGPRGRLVRKLLSWIGFIPSMPEASLEPDAEIRESESYLRPNFLPRITLTDIWKPASRESCGSNVWKMFRTGASILFSRSILQEPAFQELILLYTEEVSQNGSGNVGVLPLQLKIYERIPYPDLPVVFPHKKLSFRILDTVRLDVASIVGLLAYFVNYKFENIVSSPSAFFLDILAISALILYATRVVLGYKQTWDRYQLLVNRTLYEKTLASGFGSVHFLLDASEQQQYKEAILAYAILLHAEKFQVSCRKSFGDACEKFMYDRFQEKVEMPIDKAIDTLLRLDIVREISSNGRFELKALPCLKAYEALRCRWNSLLL